MAKIVVECTDPNDLDAIEAAAEQMVGRCNVTYFKQAQGMVEAGTAKSEREASRKISEETGETPQAIRHKIRRGKGLVVRVGPQPSKPRTKPTPQDSIVSDAFKEAFEGLHREIKNAKYLKWRDTSKEAALKYLEVLYDTVTIS